MPLNSGGRVCEAPSCGVGGATIESFQGVNLLTKRPALIPIEETLPQNKNQVLVSCFKVKTQTLIELKTFLAQGRKNLVLLIQL